MTLNHRNPIVWIASAVFLIAAACDDPKGPGFDDVPTAEQLIAEAQAAGMVRVNFPDPDPGIPAYARLSTTLDQVFHTDEWVAIPFYRSPAAVPDDFNLLAAFDFPGPDGPGAFAAPLQISGHFMIEADAPLGTFPKVAISTGSAVPFWFVEWSVFQAAMADNVVTMAELRAMPHLEGVATQFSETLRPRVGEHLVVISAKGTLADGRNFDFNVTHVEDVTRNVRISIR